MTQVVVDPTLKQSRAASVRGAPDQVKEVWRRYRKTKTDKARNELLEAYSPWAVREAKKVARGLPSCVDEQDLAQEAMFGLMHAIDAFDPDRAIKFETFASRHVRGAALDYVRHNDWAPRLVRQRAKLVERAKQRLQNEIGRAPDDDELQVALGVEDDEYERIRRDASTVSSVSLQAHLRGGGGDGGVDEVAELIADRHAECPTRRADVRDAVRWMLKSLSRVEYLAVVLYYDEEMKMSDVGESLGLCESRVSQILNSVRLRLKAKLKQTPDGWVAQAG